MNGIKHLKRIAAAFLSALVLAEYILPACIPYGTGISMTAHAATQATVNTDRLNVRSGPGTDYDIVTVLTANTSVTVNSEVSGSDGYTWYSISWSGGSGYARYDYIKLEVTYAIQDSAFESYLDEQGFPESYKNALRGLHEQYPNWIFEAQHTGLDWTEAVAEESKIGKNLVASTSISSWKSTMPGAFDWANNYWPGFDGDSWVQASEELIAHYMDPRNFLTDPYIFQFEIQNYDPSVQNKEGLEALIKDTFLDGNAVVPVEGSVIDGGTVIPGSVYTKGTAAASASSSSSSESSTAVIGPSSGSSSSSGIGPGGGTSSSSNVIIGVGVTPGSSSSDQNVYESGSYKVIGALDNLTGVITSYAGQWVNEESEGVYNWYYIDDDGSRYADGWYWIDGNSDGISECYYFYSDGTMAYSTVIDGYTVNADGQWVDDSGTIQTKGSSSGELKEVAYSDIIMYAASESGVSPYVIASTILQEQGSGTSNLISGSDSTYPGYYNFFNINAYAQDGLTAVQAGLKYAYEMGWDTIEKSIIEGAVSYGTNYVNQGQDTYYLKKFNVQGSNLYNHQYMTHVLAAASEGAQVSAAYSSSLKNSALKFKIPVYLNMPDTPASLPSGDGNPNNKLSSLSVDGYTITPTFNMDTTEYSLIVEGSSSSVNINAVVIDSNATVEGAGTVTLNTGLNTVVITVTAENGDVREYTLSITRRDDGTAATTSVSQEVITDTSSAGPGVSIVSTQEDQTSAVSVIGPTTSAESDGVVVIGQPPQ